MYLSIPNFLKDWVYYMLKGQLLIYHEVKCGRCDTDDAQYSKRLNETPNQKYRVLTEMNNVLWF